MTHTQPELIEAHNALLSLLNKCKSINISKQKPPQATLLKRRIAALEIAIQLVEAEIGQ